MSAKNWGIGIVVVAVIGAGGWAYQRRESKPKQRTQDFFTVTEGPIENTVEATGSVAPLNRVEIKPPIAGRIEQLIIDEGARVVPGQILAWMSSSDRAAILDAARAQGPESVAHWQDAYKPTPIMAPLAGVVILRNIVVGQTVDASVVLYAMSDFLVVIAQVDESDIGQIHLGMPARVWLDAYPSRKVTGKVFDILYEGKNISNVIQYGVKIKIDKVPDYYRSQMTANVSFIIGKKNKALLIPASTIREAASGVKQVQMPSPDGGKAITREIKTGVESGDFVEVVSGLTLGDHVLPAHGKYTPQQAPASSPLTSMGGRPSSGSGTAPRPRQ